MLKIIDNDFFYMVSFGKSLKFTKVVDGTCNHYVLTLFGKNFNYKGVSFRSRYRSFRRRLADARLYLVDFITQRTIYAWYESRDCDHTFVAYAREFRNIKAYNKALEDEADWAEGPWSMRRMSKADYEDMKDEYEERDYILEAHEDGHPYNVRY